MKHSNLIEIYKNGNLVIPMFLLKNFDKFNLKLNEFIFLMYLDNLGNNSLFDPIKYSNDLNLNNKEILSNIDVLTNKGFIKVEVVKNDKNVMEEVIILDGYYNKLASIMIDNVNENSEINSDIFTILEQEFGRNLTPIELEISKAWLTNGISEELIKEAIKEAVFNHVVNLKYIDKILYEWGKNGIKNKNDVDENRKRRNFKEKEESNIDLESVDWDWFDDED